MNCEYFDTLVCSGDYLLLKICKYPNLLLLLNLLGQSWKKSEHLKYLFLKN